MLFSVQLECSLYKLNTMNTPSTHCTRQCVTLTFAERFRLVFSLSGFANLSKKITTKREFRLSLSFLLSEKT